MGFFKKKIVKGIEGGAWGHLVNFHGLDVDTLSREFRCVDREGSHEGRTVTLLRVFKPSEAERKGISVTGWETFDSNPDLVYFEGHITKTNEAHLERKRD